ncbi:hypothetical protein ULMS_05460 [Patiriisocius marinistellae]|uniref:DUF3298/DUF4163 domain-containing protein n=1 Tax=Patiriisocius marinistellae TaxID=2494560 RepID=A0A5J4FV21_9FLAO|nr:DUF3298 and DUF4163 domain-containing protein [Patiriisocius marinistellae]GEQ85038.1 hypothetical protein ULMS_05460 [Patiriisocius marinistellae]
MINKIASLFLLFLLIISCNDTPLVASEISFTHKDLASCNTVECPEIFVNYPKFSGEVEVTKAINASVEQFIIESLYLDDPEQKPTAKNIQEAAQQFIDMYRMHNAEFPDLAIDYYSEIEIEESFRSEEIISIELYQEKYTGGAHGYRSLSYGNFSIKTGQKIPANKLFKDLNIFTKFAETYFRSQHNIQENKEINSTGFWFDDNKFYLPESIGFNKKSFVLHYNQYEIASYAEGPIEVEIPLKDVAQYLNVSLKK